MLSEVLNWCKSNSLRFLHVHCPIIDEHELLLYFDLSESLANHLFLRPFPLTSLPNDHLLHLPIPWQFLLILLLMILLFLLILLVLILLLMTPFLLIPFSWSLSFFSLNDSSRYFSSKIHVSNLIFLFLIYFPLSLSSLFLFIIPFNFPLYFPLFLLNPFSLIWRKFFSLTF